MASKKREGAFKFRDGWDLRFFFYSPSPPGGILDPPLYVPTALKSDLTRHVPCPGAFYIYTSTLAKHDDLRYFLVLQLIVHAIMRYMTGNFFDEMIRTPSKVAKIQSDLGSGVPQDLHGLGQFSQNFGLVKDIIESDVKGDISAINNSRNK